MYESHNHSVRSGIDIALSSVLAMLYCIMLYAALPFDEQNGISVIKGVILRGEFPLRSYPASSADRLIPYELCYQCDSRDTSVGDSSPPIADSMEMCVVSYGRITDRVGMLFPVRETVTESVDCFDASGEPLTNTRLIESLRGRYIQDMIAKEPLYSHILTPSLVTNGVVERRWILTGVLLDASVLAFVIIIMFKLLNSIRRVNHGLLCC